MIKYGVVFLLACGSKTVVGGKCAATSDCVSGAQCVSGRCQLVLGSACDNDAQCGAAAACVSGVCADSSLRGDFTLTVDDVAVAADGTANVAVHVTPSGGLPDDITVTLQGGGDAFTAPSISTRGTATLTLTAHDAACGETTLTARGVAGDITHDATFSVNVNAPASVSISAIAPVTLLRGGQRAVALQVSKDKCADATFTVSGGANGVSGTLAGTGLTITATNAATLTTTHLTVAGGGATATVDVTVTGTVTATVLDGFGRRVGAGAVHRGATNTNGSGQLSFASAAPYDLAITVPGAPDYTIVYKDLNEPNPVVQTPTAIVPWTYSPVWSQYVSDTTGLTAGDDYQLTGGVGDPVAYNAPTQHWLVRTFSGDNATGTSWEAAWKGFDSGDSDPDYCNSWPYPTIQCRDGSIEINSDFYEEDVVNRTGAGKVHALQFAITGTPNLFYLEPTSYTGYAEADATLKYSTDVKPVLAMTPVATNATPFTATLAYPANYKWASFQLYAHLGKHGNVAIGRAGDTGLTSFVRKTPTLSGTTANLITRVYTNVGVVFPVSIDHRATAGLTDAVAIAPPVASDLSAPAPNTNASTSTPFTWNAFGDEAAYVLNIAASGTLAPVCYLVTTHTSLHAADPAEGCALTSSQGYLWSISAVGGYSSTDDVVRDGYGWLTDANQVIFRGDGTERDGGFSLSTTRAFKAP